jgi:hypothetical protein
MKPIIAIFLGGCTVLVHVDSRPVPAEVETPTGEHLRLPADVPLRWRPFARPELLCSAVGYRPMVVPVRLGLGPLAPRGVRPLELSMVPEHGPTGTWSESEVP